VAQRRHRRASATTQEHAGGPDCEERKPDGSPCGRRPLAEPYEGRWLCWAHHPERKAEVKRAAAAGGRARAAQVARKAAEQGGKPSPASSRALREVLEHPPTTREGLAALLARAGVEVVSGRLLRWQAQSLVDIVKLLKGLLSSEDVGDRALLAATAGLTPEEAAGLSMDELVARARAAVGNPMAGPASQPS
jgi:hypothetical protein